MLIKSVKLHNIRTYLDQEVELPQGTVLLSGDVGSGKSTILLAIEFALFGISKGLLSGEALLRQGKQSGYVELFFSFDGKEVLIRRTLKRVKDSIRQDEGWLAVNGVRQFCTAEELKAKVLEMIGYPKELLKKSKGLIYRFTVYTPQEDMKLILFEDPQVRLDTLRRVFQVDKYKLVREGAAVVAQALRERKRELSARVEGLPLKQEQLAKLSGELAVVGNKLAALAPVIASADGLLQQKQDSARALEEKARKLNMLKSQLAAVAAVAAEKSRLMVSKEAEIVAARNEVAAIRSADVDSGVEKLSIALSRLKSFSDSLLKEAERKKSLEDGLMLAEQLMSEAGSDISRAEALKYSSEQLQRKISSLDSCPTCLQPVPVEHKHRVFSEENGRVAGLELKLAAAAEKKGVLAQKVKSLKSELGELQSKEKIAAGLAAELKQYLELASALKVAIPVAAQSSMSVAEMQLELTSLYSAKREFEMSRERALLAAEKERSILHAQSFIESCRAELNLLELKRAELSASIASLGDVDKESVQLQAELASLMKERTNLLMQRASLEKETQGLDAMQQALSDEVSRMAEAKRELDSAANVSCWLDEMFVSLVGVIERHVMMKVHQEFSTLFRDWFAMLMGNEALSARLDEDFTPVIEADGFEIPVENLSGGEKTSCALAYRLALNMVINNLVSTIRTKDVLILDEPTDGFSAEQLEKLRDVLMRLQLPQVILVSHEDRIESFVQHVIRVQKEQNVSRIVA